MDAVTYPNPAVIDFIQRNMVPLRIQSNNETLGLKFKIKWTPTLIMLDKDGNEHYRSVGFLRPDALLASLMLGIGRTHLDRGEYQEAISHFDKAPCEVLKKRFHCPSYLLPRSGSLQINKRFEVSEGSLRQTFGRIS